MAALVREYLQHARRCYAKPNDQPSGEAERVEIALRRFIQYCPSLPAEHFGPLALKSAAADGHRMP